MKRSAFTLIELLCVMAIIGLLAALAVPAVDGFIEKARQVKCVNNLKQIFVFTQSAANDNDNRFPKIIADPEHPPGAYAGDPGAKPIYEMLKPYGCNEATLQCPTDLVTKNNYATKHTSFMWAPFSEDEPTSQITVVTPRGSFPGRLSRVRLCSDWEPVHAAEGVGGAKRWNTLYADGHVTLR